LEQIYNQDFCIRRLVQDNNPSVNIWSLAQDLIEVERGLVAMKGRHNGVN
jgi:hypothetical protein